MKIKSRKDNNWIHFVLLILFLSAAIFILIIVKKFTGFVTNQVNASAGSITTLILDDRQVSAHWAGLFGLAFSEAGFNETQTATVNPGQISAVTMVFNCISPNEAQQEMYASTNNSIDFSNIRAGTFDMIDVDYLNLTNDTRDRANNTFTDLVNITVGVSPITNVPAVYTYVNSRVDPDKKFFTGILNASGKLVIVARLYLISTTSYKGSNVKYQMLLPVPNASTVYYFFPDPNDNCPAGFGIGQIGDAVVNGFVLETNTSLPIPNATVSAGGNSSLTDSNGFFNLTVPGNKIHNLVTIREGYNTNITIINTTIGQITNLNLTMSKFFGFIGPNATISGYVKDNSTNSTLANVTISIAGLTAISNDTGNYSFIVSEGTHVMAAIKNGYNNFVGNFSILRDQNLSFIINMSLVSAGGAQAQNGVPLNNGTIQGFVKDNSTNASLADVTVTVAGQSNTTNGSGFYNITALQGTTNLVAIKSSYETFAREVNISANNITVFNFSMSAVVIATGVSNGSVKGVVKSSTGSVLTDVTVSVAGSSNLSNSSGDYLLLQIPAGTHVLAATKSNYTNYVTTINVTADATTEKNITMTTTTEAGLGAGSGAGKGSGSGAGKGPGSGAGKGAGLGPGNGAGTGIPAELQQTTQIVDYEISVKKIIKKLRVGNFIGVPITITNLKQDSMSMTFSVEGDVKKMTRLDKERLIVEGGSSGDVTPTFVGNVEPGVYEGNLVISGDINEKIPIYILVLEKERLSVESLVIKITPADRKVKVGDIFKYTVDLQNLLSEEKYKVSLSYSIQGINSNKSIFLEKEDIAIHTSFSLLKSFKVPNNLEIGDYALKVKADFLDLSSEQSTIFSVVVPLYKYAVFGLVPLWVVFLFISTLSVGTFSTLIYKKRKEEKKRYKIELDYSSLPKAGPRSAFVGNIAETHNKSYFDLDLFQVHTLVAGSSGSGKSVVAQDLVEEALLKGVAVIVFDPTAQWTGFLRKCEDKKLIGLYKNFGMKKTDARAFNGNVHSVTDARELIEFKKFMKSGEINVFVTNKLETKDIELFVSNTIRQVFHANLPESKELKYLMVYDGIHSLMPKFGGSGQVFVQIERATREFRKWGVGLILISQVLSDFPPEVLANINTEIQVRTRDEGDLNRVKEKYGDKILQSVVKASVGAGVVQNSAYNKGKPFFVSFRPPMHSTQRISDEELENYNKYNLMTDDLEYQLEQLEKEGIDVFDLKLELKLSQDKVKAGNFNMVNIYLDGLKPRIKSQWDKIGKTPKKKEIEFVLESELATELQRAKVERKKFEGSDEQLEEQKRNAKEQELSEGKDINNNQGIDNDSDEIEDTINDLAEKIKNFIGNNEKPKAVELYSKVQEIYKNTPKEQKAKVLGKCIEIQKLLR